MLAFIITLSVVIGILTAWSHKEEDEYNENIY